MPAKGPKRRPEQVAESIRAVLAGALVQGEVRDPRVGMVTVSHVEVTRDMSVATVRVAPHADTEEAKDEAIVGLQSAAGYLRRMVATTLTSRTVPELRFVRDRGLVHALRINELLEGIRREEDPS